MAQLLRAPFIKKVQDMSRNGSLFISEVGKIVRLLLLSQARNTESDGA